MLPFPPAGDAVRNCVTKASGFETSPPGQTQISPHSLSFRTFQTETKSQQAMEKFWFLLICLLDVLVHLGTGQHRLRAPVGPWRQRIQWENNGQVYSLLSTGTQYRLPSQNRRGTQLLLATRNSLNPVNPPVALMRSTRTRSMSPQDTSRHHSEQNDQTETSILGADVGQYLLAPDRNGTHSQSNVVVDYRSSQAPSNSSSAVFIQEFSGSGIPRGGRGTADDSGAQQATAPPVRAQDLTHSLVDRTAPESSDSAHRSVWVTLANDGRVTQLTRTQSLTRVTPGVDDSSNAVEIHFPRRSPDTTGASDPHSIHHRNSVFYNVYPADRRNRQNARNPPGTGHGTRFFRNGEVNSRLDFNLFV
ncbi:hypothetical protein GOODEAATRI_021403 [Goodea atripinnis]|uniref:Uncharacterized protein n=1 Tax=Goodea atripinnis TaxID=208336 RepID=A0ABV0NM60_9TELE